MGPPQMDISNLMQFTGEGNFTGEAPASPDLAIEQAVNAEMSIARTYLDIVLKVQMAYYQKKSATTAIMLNRKLFGTKAPIAPAALLEEENDDAEEDDAAEVADADEENDDAPDVDQSADDEAADDADEVNQSARTRTTLKMTPRRSLRQSWRCSPPPRRPSSRTWTCSPRSRSVCTRPFSMLPTCRRSSSSTGACSCVCSHWATRSPLSMPTSCTS